MTPHIHRVRVYYEDTDGGGVVYYANYLKFAERARTELLRHTGFGQRHLLKDTGVLFMVREASIQYLSSARLDDEVCVETTLTDVTSARIIFQQNMYVADTAVAQATISVVTVQSKTGTVTRIPESVKEKLKEYTA